MKIDLFPHQLDALSRIRNGCILCGGVGSGKSRTALAYYYIQNGGEFRDGAEVPMRKKPQDLYIITTARKRDDQEWLGDMLPFMLTPFDDVKKYDHKVVIDSWNNIQKYKDVQNAFFIFDEQRVVGYGAWSKSFIQIAHANNWILLSATPGDTWSDYAPVFIANGFYRNITEFRNEHVIYSCRFHNFPVIDRYVGTTRLQRLKERILVDMPFDRHTERHTEYCWAEYNREKYREIMRERWNEKLDEPMRTASELCAALRRCVNTDISRQKILLDIVHAKKKVIVFYSFDYERDILLGLDYGPDYQVAEWSGHAHQDVPDGEHWVYIVQYTAGAEGWNCVKTDTIVFYSEQYSYKILEQSSGRIDRMNTPYTDLYYYHIRSRAPIDNAIARALDSKKKFNESKFIFGRQASNMRKAG